MPAATSHDADDRWRIAAQGSAFARPCAPGCRRIGRLCCTSTSRTRAEATSSIGGLGFPVVFNNMIQNFVTNRARTLPQAHEICSFFDPYVGRDAGYLQVTRLSGAGPALSSRRSRDENAVRGISSAERRDAPRPDVRRRVRVDVAQQRLCGQRMERRRAVERADVGDAETGESRSYGLRLLVSDEIKNIEKTLAANDRPVAVGIPGYIVPMDLDAKLFLQPGSARSRALRVEPAGALRSRPRRPRRAASCSTSSAARSGAASRLTSTTTTARRRRFTTTSPSRRTDGSPTWAAS